MIILYSSRMPFSTMILLALGDGWATTDMPYSLYHSPTTAMQGEKKNINSPFPGNKVAFQSGQAGSYQLPSYQNLHQVTCFYDVMSKTSINLVLINHNSIQSECL